MFHWVKKSIKNKIIVLVMSIIFLLGCLTVIVTFFANKSFLTEEDKGVLRGLTAESSYVTDRNISSYLAVTKTMSTHPALTSYLRNPSASQRETVTSLLEKQNNDDLFNEITVLGKDGLVSASTDISMIGKNYSQTSSYKKAMNGELSISYIADMQKKETSYSISAPIQEDNGEKTGVLIGRLSNDMLFGDLTSDEVLSHSNHFMITDENGLVLYSNDNTHALKSIGTLTSPEKERIMTNSINVGNLAVEAVGYDKIKESIKDYRGPSNYSIKDGKKGIVAMSRVGALPFFIILEKEESEITMNALKNTVPIIILSLLAISLATVYILFFVNRIMKPIDTLKKVMKSIGRGHLDQDVNIKTVDEFRDLGDAVVLMTLELKEKEMINKIRNEKNQKRK